MVSVFGWIVGAVRAGSNTAAKIKIKDPVLFI